MVVTITVAVPVPFGKRLGFRAQVVKVAETGKEQDRSTGVEKPFRAVTEIALVKVAVCPALTVCAVVPPAVIEKSGGGVTVKFTGAEDVGEGIGLITVSG